MKMKFVDSIFFISVIRPLSAQANSTNIMTSALLEGMKKQGKRVVFFAICEYPEEMSDVKAYFSQIVDCVIPLPSGFGHGLSKYQNLNLMLLHSVSIGIYRKKMTEALREISFQPDLIVSHSPSFEAVCYSRAMRPYYKETPYYEYWSDPIALSGITPEQMNAKRLPFRWLEYRALTYCDRIIYGTKTLMLFQQALYPDLAGKMRYIDIPYIEKEEKSGKQPKKNSLLYAGNFFSKLRNIQPLVDAVSQMPDYTLDVYGDGDCQPPDAANIVFHGRISPDQLSEIEEQFSCMVCVLNHACIQIPGKVFYDMMRPCNILVITDGTHSEELNDYLKSYHRFLFCKNTSADITVALCELDQFTVDLDEIRARFSPGAIAETLVAGGMLDKQ